MTGGIDLVEPVGILRDLYTIGAQHHGALAHDDVALIDADFLDVIEGDGVGFEIDGFFAIGFLCMSGKGQQRGAQPRKKSSFQ